MIIAIPDDYQNLVRKLDCFARLAGHEVRVFQGPARSEDELVAQLADADAAVVIRERTSLTRAVVERLPRLKHIAQTGRSHHAIDVAACTERGIMVTAGSHASPHTVAEHAWTLILAALRRIPQQVATMRSGTWLSHIAYGLRGRTLGICGFGAIGALVAPTGAAFGMRVLAWGRDKSAALARTAGYDTAPSRRDLFEQSDVLSLHLRLSSETRGIVTAGDLAAMKPTALLVNTARAELIAPGALVEALKKGRPGLAAVDVYEQEPVLNGSHPLLKMDNVICTPHSAWLEKDMLELYFGEAFEQVLAFAAGGPVGAVNPEALRRVATRSA